MSVGLIRDGGTMKIYVNRVPEAGIRGHARYDPTTMDMDRDDVHLREAFAVEAMIVKADRELVVTAQIDCPLSFTCARCLEEFPATLKTHAVFSYKVQPTDVVDITDEVRQEIILAYPMVPVCQPDCQGLCGVCGQNLNTVSCGHQPSR